MGNYVSDCEAKSLIVEIGKRMYNKGFVSGSDGNITIKVDDNAVWATPTGVCKGYMTEDMLLKLDLDGHIIEKGDLNSTSEIKMHLRVYKENADIQAVVHAHPPMGTAFSVAGMPIDMPMMAENVVFLGVIPIAPYALPGSQEVPDSVAPFCKDYNGCFLANHGTLTWGENPLEAYYRLESLENSCYIQTTLTQLNKMQLLTEEQVNDLYDLRKRAGFKRGGMMKR
ncbi:class II aldolase/adducin family protein [Vallitalea pronyensis]|uniref:Class II aldolase/adducin family protein n=1 Tax=Vallitalea pronyensis TaxID=1348613 RepID=A0A8J8MPP8_9FIRM|nr:class II aldolase/adducin family protein [Vallitalea pronyensis]QUI25281.1 class II aldolase/adducin family protein [Vallitalea pronyensis]